MREKDLQISAKKTKTLFPKLKITVGEMKL